MLEGYAQVQEALAELPYRLDSYSCIEGTLLDITGYARRLCISIEGTLLDLLYRLDSYSPTAKTLVVYTQQHQWHSIELVYLTWIQMDIGQPLSIEALALVARRNQQHRVSVAVVRTKEEVALALLLLHFLLLRKQGISGPLQQQYIQEETMSSKLEYTAVGRSHS